MKLTAMIRRRLALALAALAAAFPAVPGAAQHVTQVIDRSGDGRGNPLGEPRDLALDEDDNLYVVGYGSDNVFRITPDGLVETILDASGDGQGNVLNGPTCVAAQRGNVYVGASLSQNLFRIPPDGPPVVLLDGFGMGDVALDAQGNVFVLGSSVRRLAPDGTLTTILPAGLMERPRQLAVSPSGNVYVADAGSFYPEWGAVFRVTPDGEITRLMGGHVGFDPSPYAMAWGITVDAEDNVYVTSAESCCVLWIDPDGTITTLLDDSVNCMGNLTDHENVWTYGVALDALGYLQVASLVLDFATNDAGFDIQRYHPTNGLATRILRSVTHDPIELDPYLLWPRDLVVDSLDRTYVSGIMSDNVFRIDGASCDPVAPKSTLRFGSGANPPGLFELAPPVIGGFWELRVDTSGLGAPIASLLFLSRSGPLPPVPTPVGELLIAPPYVRHLAPQGEVPRRHDIPLPYDCGLLGRTIFAQAAVVRANPLRVQLQNAIDGQIGTLGADG